MQKQAEGRKNQKTLRKVHQKEKQTLQVWWVEPCWNGKVQLNVHTVLLRASAQSEQMECELLAFTNECWQ
jgi:hypothetical protein